ncbi:MAG: DUF116 domain-containing protein [Bacillota bacterium]|nr:DUF116 domain-containing protein [Bacillota bacterium]
MESRKRVYVGLMGVSLLVIILIAFVFWLFVQHKELFISKMLMIIVMGSVAVLFGILFIGILGITIMILKRQDISFFQKVSHIADEVLFPLTISVGRLLGINKQKILRSYIAVNNNLVKSKKIKVPGQKILLLLPHCLQNSDCPRKITMDVSNCKQCGKCSIGDLINLANKYHAEIRVATGGTLARKWVKELRPEVIVAVACERDLSAGIQDTGLIPVLGVLNCRPNGPCIDTSVDLNKVEAALMSVARGG